MNTRFSLLAGTIVASLAVLLMPTTSRSQELYLLDFEEELPGPGLGPFYEFHGSSDGDELPMIAPEVTATGGVDGSQGFSHVFDSSEVTQWYFGGFGHYSVFADDNTLLAGGVPGSDDPSRYRWSADIKLEGADGTAASTPLLIRMAAIDGIYEMRHGIDINGDEILDEGAAVYVAVVNPTITSNGEYVNVSFTMDQGTQDVNPNVLEEHRVFSNNLALLWQFNWGGEHFGFDAGNVISIDNVRIEFLEEVTAIPGDFNNNGAVENADLTLLLNNWGAAVPPTPAGWTGIPPTVPAIDNDELTLLLNNWGNTLGSASASAAVPEPAAATLALAAIGGAWMLRRRRS